MFDFFKEVYLERQGIVLNNIDEIMKVKEVKREKQRKILYKTILIIAFLGHAMMNIFLSIIIFENLDFITLIRTVLLVTLDFIFIAILFLKYWKTRKQKVVVFIVSVIYLCVYMLKYIS